MKTPITIGSFSIVTHLAMIVMGLALPLGTRVGIRLSIDGGFGGLILRRASHHLTFARPS